MNAKFLLPLLCSLLWVSQAGAATRYISDNVYAFLHAGPSNQYRIIGTINAGEQVEFLGGEEGSEYVQIQDAEGRTGWMDGQYLQRQPSFRSRLPALEQELSEVKAQLASADERHANELAGKLRQIEHQQQQLSELQARLDELGASHEQLAADNQRLSSQLDDREHQMRMDWLVRGGLVAGAGALVGLVLPMVPLRRRKRQDRWMN